MRINSLAFLLAATLNACATQVTPWERGHLAKPHMSMEPNRLEASIRKHIHISKEASSGGYGSGGGGCGCN